MDRYAWRKLVTIYLMGYRKLYQYKLLSIDRSLVKKKKKEAGEKIAIIVNNANSCNLFEFLEVLNLFKNVYSLFREN